MYQPVTFFIGFRYMRGRSADKFARFVSWLSSIGITLGVMAMIVVISVMNGFDKEQKKNFLSMLPQAVISTDKGYLNPNEVTHAEIAALFPQVETVPVTMSDVVIQSADKIGVAVMLGVTADDKEPLADFILNSELSALRAGDYNMILGEQLANQLKIGLGQQVRVMVPSASQLTPMGRIPSQRLFTVIGTFSSGTDVDLNQVLVNQQDASRLMRYPQGNVTGWRLFLSDPFAVEQLSQQALPSPLKWQDWRDKKGDLFQAIKMEGNMMKLLMSLIIMVAAFNLITSLSLLVMEKQNEVAILMTQGLTRLKVMAVFMIQGASAGIIGTFIGSILGVTIALNLNQIMPTMGGLMLPVDLRIYQILIIVLATMTISLLSTLYPSWRAARVHPAEALRYE